MHVATLRVSSTRWRIHWRIRENSARATACGMLIVAPLPLSTTVRAQYGGRRSLYRRQSASSQLTWQYAGAPWLPSSQMPSSTYLHWHGAQPVPSALTCVYQRIALVGSVTSGLSCSDVFRQTKCAGCLVLHMSGYSVNPQRYPGLAGKTSPQDLFWTHAFPQYTIEYIMRISAVLCCIASNTYTV
jgi:hypothetical protein